MKKEYQWCVVSMHFTYLHLKLNTSVKSPRKLEHLPLRLKIQSGIVVPRSGPLKVTTPDRDPTLKNIIKISLFFCSHMFCLNKVITFCKQFRGLFI